MGSKKDKTTTALLSVFLGWIGVHRFYLNQVGLGILYLLFSWTGIPLLIGIIDFFVFLGMSEKEFHRRHNHNLPYISKNMVSFPKKPQQRPARPQNINQPPPRYRTVNQPPVVQKPKPDYYKNVLNKVHTLRNEIIQKVKNTDTLTSELVGDIEPLADKYINQVKRLIERDKKLKVIISGISQQNIDENINDFKQKYETTENQELKKEYETAISKYEQHKNTYKDFSEQREIIKMRLDSTVINLEQMKFDLIKLESLNTYEQREEVSKMFEEKSKELSNYLEILQNNYNDDELTI